MPIKLDISIEGPLAPEDRELLTGISIMVMAIANHELAKARFPETFEEETPQEQEQEQEPPQVGGICGKPDGGSKVCINTIGHRGRHRFRDLPVANGMN